MTERVVSGWTAADMDAGNTANADTLMRRPGGFVARRHRVAGLVILLAIALVGIGVAAAFVHASSHLAAVRSDALASSERVAALGHDLAKATSDRDESRREAALARTALETARAAHLHTADVLASERSELARARTQAYASLVDASHRSTQLNALHTCLDGVSQALDMLGSGDVNGWHQRLQQIDGACREAEAVAA